MLVVRVRITIPIQTQRFVTAILHGPDRFAGTFVDVEHLATVFGHVAVEHFPGSDSATAIGIVGISDRFHFSHVFLADVLVATFVKDNTGVIAVVDDGVTHEFNPLFPLAPRRVLFRVTGWHGLNQPNPVARLHILFPRRDMHPTHQVSVAFHHQVVAVVT